VLEDGRVLDVSNVIWCTGYTPDFSWIDLALPTTRHGFPIQDRGIVESVPGLYFMGLLFQYSLSSALVGGVGRDAKYIVDHIASRRVGTWVAQDLDDPRRAVKARPTYTRT
jgi:putative flavoprotein involved in K+ transport